MFLESVKGKKRDSQSLIDCQGSTNVYRHIKRILKKILQWKLIRLIYCKILERRGLETIIPWLN